MAVEDDESSEEYQNQDDFNKDAIFEEEEDGNFFQVKFKTCTDLTHETLSNLTED